MLAIRTLLLCVATALTEAQYLRVVDDRTGAPIRGAVITVSGSTTETDGQGSAAVRVSAGDRVLLRAIGYRRTERVAGAGTGITEIRMMPFTPKAVYLTPYGLATRSLREPVISLLEQTELNAVVIDVKGDRGWIAYPSAVPLWSCPQF